MSVSQVTLGDNSWFDVMGHKLRAFERGKMRQFSLLPRQTIGRA